MLLLYDSIPGTAFSTKCTPLAGTDRMLLGAFPSPSQHHRSCVMPIWFVTHLQFSMERAAFKCTGEYMEVLGGKDSAMYEEFIVMFIEGLQAARKYATVTITMMEIMMFKVISISWLMLSDFNYEVSVAFGGSAMLLTALILFRLMRLVMMDAVLLCAVLLCAVLLYVSPKILLLVRMIFRVPFHGSRVDSAAVDCRHGEQSPEVILQVDVGGCV